MSKRECDVAPEASRRLIGARSDGALSCIVAIPVCNERERIVGCLDALAQQIKAHGVGVLLFLNNCTDGTRTAVDTWSRGSSPPIRIIEADSPSATAGWARRRAMDAGAAWLDEVGAQGGLLLTTDADSRVPPDWVFRNRAAVAAGADAVAGCVRFDAADLAAFPLPLLRRQQLETAYESLLAEIEARLDPRQGDPWPSHRTRSGASIAVTLAAYRSVGGMPPLRSGEDHAFLEAVVARGLVVRHAPDIVVTTSGRLDGRATGGTAETLRSWQDDLGRCCDARLESLSRFVGRILVGRFHPICRQVASKHLAGRPLRPRELPRQIRRARRLLTLIRALETRRYGSRPSAPDLSAEMPKRLSLP